MKGPLKVDELEMAKLKWIQSIQEHHYKEEIYAIRFEKPNNLKNQLGLQLDKNGIIRCVGCLMNADITEGAKYPILLPRRNYFTDLIIDQSHRRAFHVGSSQTLAIIRQTYWIPKGRAEVKRVLNRCQTCHM